MISKKLENKFKMLYSQILSNKLIAICVLFTFFTLLDTAGIIFGFWPPKTAIGVYTHLLGRFVLHSILVGGLYIFDLLRKRFKSKILIYFITFFLNWGILLIYLGLNNLFIQLHPDAFIDASISFIFMYLLLGIVILIFNSSKKNNENINL